MFMDVSWTTNGYFKDQERLFFQRIIFKSEEFFDLFNGLISIANRRYHASLSMIELKSMTLHDYPRLNRCTHAIYNIMDDFA